MMKEIKIRASQLGLIMTGLTELTEKQKQTLAEYQNRYSGNGKPLTDNQIIEFGKLIEKSKNTEISQTAKSEIEKIFIENEYGFSENLYTDPILKGRMLEQQAIELVSELDRKYYVKNETNYKNEYLSGTPDIIHKDRIIDIKVPDDYENFFKSDIKSLYFAQGQAYMDLTGLKVFELVYVLMPEPDNFLSAKLQRLSYKLSSEDYDKAEIEILNNNIIINSLPLSQRVRRFTIEYDPEYIESAKRQIEKCRLYYNSLFEKFNLNQ